MKHLNYWNQVPSSSATQTHTHHTHACMHTCARTHTHTHTHMPTCAWGASARKGNATISGRSSHYTISEEERKRGEGMNKRARNYAMHMRNYYVSSRVHCNELHTWYMFSNVQQNATGCRIKHCCTLVEKILCHSETLQTLLCN